MCLSERLSFVLWFDFFLIHFRFYAILSNILAFILLHLDCRSVYYSYTLTLWLSHVSDITLDGGLCGSDLSGLATGILWIAIGWHCLWWGLIGLNKCICLSVHLPDHCWMVLTIYVESTSKISSHRQCEIPYPLLFSPICLSLWMDDQKFLVQDSVRNLNIANCCWCFIRDPTFYCWRTSLMWIPYINKITSSLSFTIWISSTDHK